MLVALWAPWIIEAGKHSLQEKGEIREKKKNWLAQVPNFFFITGRGQFMHPQS